MKRLLITGATGFIGHRFISFLKPSDYEVRILSRKKHPVYETIVCDLQLENIPEDTLKGIDIVFHLAGLAHDLSDSTKIEKLYREVNVNATVRLAELASRHGVQHFIFLSSVKAGGSVLSEKCLTEDDQMEPEGVYGKTKREAELELLDIDKRSTMQISIIRSSLVYGPGVKGNLRLMLSSIEKWWFPPLPEINNRLSMIHVDDLSKALLLVSANYRTNGEIYIATDAETYSSRKIYEAMCDLSGKTVPSWSVPKFIFDFLALISPRKRYQLEKLFRDECYSSSKLESLGFCAKYSIKDWS